MNVVLMAPEYSRVQKQLNTIVLMSIIPGPSRNFDVMDLIYGAQEHEYEVISRALNSHSSIRSEERRVGKGCRCRWSP